MSSPPHDAPHGQISTRAGEPSNHLPRWLKWTAAGFLAVWLLPMVHSYGISNILWLCEIGNVVTAVALWRENRVLLSAQLVGLLLVDLAWGADLLVALAAGFHPFGATANMFDPAISLPVRLGSLFHLFIPGVLLFTIWRLGYDRRGLALQSALTWVVLPVSFVAGAPAANVNWVRGLGFDAPQHAMPPELYLLLCMVAYPLVLYLPVHLAATRWLTGRAHQRLACQPLTGKARQGLKRIGSGR